MKSFRYTLLLVLFVLNSCGDLELRYYTRINPDGSVLKRVTAIGDSSKVYGSPFSFDVSDGWEVQYKKQIEESDTLFMAIAEKKYPSVKASKMAFYSKVDSGQHEIIEVHYNSKFRWFFTFHEYNETFVQRFPYRYYKIEDFINSDEQAYFFQDDTTVINHLDGKEKEIWIENGERKLWRFIASSISAEYVNLIDSFADQNGYQSVNYETKEKLTDIFYSSFEDGPDFKNIGVLTDSLLNVSWISHLFDEGYFNEFEEEVNNRMLLLTSRDYKVEIEVPGLIYNTNADNNDKQLLSWAFEGDLFQYSDLKLFVHYRTTNWWALIVSAIVIFLFLWKAFVLKKSKH